MMKKILIVLLAIGSFSSFANCSISVDVQAPGKESQRFNRKIEKMLRKKGFKSISYSYNGNGSHNENAEYKLSLIRDGWGHHILEIENRDKTVKESMIIANVFSMKGKLISLVRRMETTCH